VEAGEIDRGGQPSRAATDDQAIKRVVHPLPNGLPHRRFPTSSPQ
jgi:hypothetical protein